MNLSDIQDQIRKCSECSLSDLRDQDGYDNPVPGCGSEEAELMIFGEAPGKTEVEKGKPFVGRAGKLLKEALDKTGINLKKVYRANVVNCRPENNNFNKVKKSDIETCSKWWKKQVQHVKPKVIVGCGNQPLQYLYGRKDLRITQVYGQFFEWEIKDINHTCWFIPVFHPSFCLRPGSPNSQNKVMSMTQEEKQEVFFNDIKAAVDKLKDGYPTIDKKQYFKMKKGSILEAEEEYICHQCNALTIEAAGLAYDMFDEFPWADIYIDREGKDVPIKGQEMGDIVVCGDGGQQRYVINMIAQYYPGKTKYPDSKKDGTYAREKAFKECLKKILKIDNIESIAFPYRIGCCLAGGDWSRYRKLLNEFAKRTDAKVSVYKYDEKEEA